MISELKNKPILSPVFISKVAANCASVLKIRMNKNLSRLPCQLDETSFHFHCCILHYSEADIKETQKQHKIIFTICKSKLRTLLLFFFHSFHIFILSYFFVYLSPLRVCRHARCSFSVGRTCKVVGSCWWTFLLLLFFKHI